MITKHWTETPLAAAGRTAWRRALAGCAALLLATLAACGGGGSGSSGPPSGSNPPPTGPTAPVVVQETARAASAAVGIQGGSVSATAADGTVYELTVPAGALADTVTITMTPVARIDGLPLSGGLAGAVNLQPSGLTFARTAFLRIAKSASAPAGTTLTGFALASGATSAERTLALAGAAELRLAVTHFQHARRRLRQRGRPEHAHAAAELHGERGRRVRKRLHGADQPRQHRRRAPPGAPALV